MVILRTEGQKEQFKKEQKYETAVSDYELAEAKKLDTQIKTGSFGSLTQAKSYYESIPEEIRSRMTINPQSIHRRELAKYEKEMKDIQEDVDYYKRKEREAKDDDEQRRRAKYDAKGDAKRDELRVYKKYYDQVKSKGEYLDFKGVRDYASDMYRYEYKKTYAKNLVKWVPSERPRPGAKPKQDTYTKPKESTIKGMTGALAGAYASSAPRPSYISGAVSTAGSPTSAEWLAQTKKTTTTKYKKYDKPEEKVFGISVSAPAAYSGIGAPTRSEWLSKIKPKVEVKPTAPKITPTTKIPIPDKDTFSKFYTEKAREEVYEEKLKRHGLKDITTKSKPDDILKFKSPEAKKAFEVGQVIPEAYLGFVGGKRGFTKTEDRVIGAEGIRRETTYEFPLKDKDKKEEVVPGVTYTGPVTRISAVEKPTLEQLRKKGYLESFKMGQFLDVTKKPMPLRGEKPLDTTSKLAYGLGGVYSAADIYFAKGMAPGGIDEERLISKPIQESLESTRLSSGEKKVIGGAAATIVPLMMPGKGIQLLSTGIGTIGGKAILGGKAGTTVMTKIISKAPKGEKILAAGGVVKKGVTGTGKVALGVAGVGMGGLIAADVGKEVTAGYRETGLRGASIYGTAKIAKLGAEFKTFDKMFGTGIKAAKKSYVTTGAKFVPEEEVFAKSVLEGKEALPKAKTIQETEKMFGKSKWVQTSGPSKIEGLVAGAGRKGEFALEDPGIYVTPIKEGSPYFLRIKDTSGKVKLKDRISSITESIIKPTKGLGDLPTVTQFETAGVSRLPKEIIKKPGFGDVKTFFKEKGQTGEAFITKRSEIGLGVLERQQYKITENFISPIDLRYVERAGEKIKIKKGDKVLKGDVLLESGSKEIEAVIPYTQKFAYEKPKTFLEEVKGFSEYTIYKGEVVPIRKAKLTIEAPLGIKKIDMTKFGIASEKKIIPTTKLKREASAYESLLKGETKYKGLVLPSVGVSKISITEQFRKPVTSTTKPYSYKSSIIDSFKVKKPVSEKKTYKEYFKPASYVRQYKKPKVDSSKKIYDIISKPSYDIISKPRGDSYETKPSYEPSYKPYDMSYSASRFSYKSPTPSKVRGRPGIPRLPSGFAGIRRGKLTKKGVKINPIKEISKKFKSSRVKRFL